MSTTDYPPNGESLSGETVPFLIDEISSLSLSAENLAPQQQGQVLEFDSSPDAAEETGIKRRLYISHFLSTWNTRVFEFGTVLFLASIFPNTLLPSSVYALVRAASAICFSPIVGNYIDRLDRLKIVRLSVGSFSYSCPRFKIISIRAFGPCQDLADTLSRSTDGSDTIMSCVPGTFDKLHGLSRGSDLTVCNIGVTGLCGKALLGHEFNRSRAGLGEIQETNSVLDRFDRLNHNR